MARTYWKNIRRTFKSTMGRFIAIFAIVMLGVGFLAGLMATVPDMRESMEEYMDSGNFYDLRVVSTMGLTDADAEALAAVEGIAQVQPAYSADLLVQAGESDVIVARAHSLPPGGDAINHLTLVDGRLPAAPGECVVEAGATVMGRSFALGGSFWLTDDNVDLDDKMARREFTIVGVVRNTNYFSFEREPASVGNGSVGLVFYILPEDFAYEVYTEIYMTAAGAFDLSSLSDEYEVLADELTDRVDAISGVRCRARYNEIYDDARAELDDGWQEYYDAKADADKELSDAWQELQDGRRELEDGEKELADGEQEYWDGAAEIEENERKIADGERQLAEARAELEDGQRQYEEGLQKLEDGERQLAEARQTLADGRAQYEAGKAQYDAGLAEYEANAADFAKLVQAKESLDAGIDGPGGMAEQFLALPGVDETAAHNLAVKLITYPDITAPSASYPLSLYQAYGLWVQAAKDYRADPDPAGAAAAAYKAATQTWLSVLKNVYTNFDGTYGPSVAAGTVPDAVLNIDPTDPDPAGQAVIQNYVKLTEALIGLNQAYTQLSAVPIPDTPFTVADAPSAVWEPYRNAAKAQLDAAKAQLDTARAQLDDAKAELEDGERLLAEKTAELEDGKKQLADSKKLLDEGWATLTDKQLELLDGKRKLAEARGELADAAEKLADARRTIAENKQKLLDGEIEYEDAVAEVEEELADARAELEDAEAELADIKYPEWYVWTREQNVSYGSFKGNASKLEAITRVFPIFFFLVAALVVSTTMTRMIEEERLQIGTMKALGYSSGEIMVKYLFYALVAALAGTFVGLAAGFYAFPTVIWSAYTMMYYMPVIHTPWRLGYALFAGGSLTALTLLVTWSACRNTLRDVPASLMLPRAPKAGKRILLEYITPLWRVLPFTWKVTCRNLLRYKKRFFMTVLGVAGCTALLVTGFGIQDSLNAIIKKQYTDVYQYGLLTAVSKTEATQRGEVHDYLFGPDFDGSLAVATEKVTQTLPDRSRVEVYMMTVQDVPAFATYADLHERISRKPTPLGEHGVVMTEKLAEIMGVKAGDTVQLENADGKKAEFTVTGVCEHYVFNYIYLGQETYRQGFGEAPEWNSILTMLPDDSQGARDGISAVLLGMDDVASVNFTIDQMTQVLNMLKSINAVVVLIIVCAAALAFVVLYNLTNINIAERVKEIATIKVLGFFDREVNAYVNRESAALSLIGMGVGLVLGIFLHRFVILTVEVDAVMFGRQILPMSYVYAAALTILFSTLVNLVMTRKLKAISMVESMKAPE